MIEAIGERAGVTVLAPRDVLCDDQTCTTEEDGAILYVDNGHLTHEGARYVVERLGLRDRLTSTTR